MSLRPFRLIAALAVTIALVFLAWPDRPRPSVVLIVIDTLRADHLGCYGYGRATSPRLDALAGGGVRFTNARATSSWTAASVGSILTARYPAVHGVETSTSVLNERIPTLAEAFQTAGYATAAFSANPVFVSPVMGFARGFDRFDIVHGPSATRDSPLEIIPIDPQFKQFVQVARADRMTDAALAWLDARGTTSSPFFLYVHYLDPHADYFPPPEYAERFGVDPKARLAGVAQRPVLRSFRAPKSAEDLATLVGLYDAEIAFTDVHVGRLVDEVARRLTHPFVVVVTADHGEEFGDHGGLGHGITLWEEQLQVPLILFGSGVTAGQTIDVPFSLVGIWSLLSELTGVQPPPDSDASPVPLLRDRGPVAGHPIFADLERPSPGLEHLHGRAAIDGTWKLIVSSAGEAHLYDLADDPREQHEVDPSQGERRESLKRVLGARDRHAMEMRDRAAPGASEISAERREQLEALGYLQSNGE